MIPLLYILVAVGILYLSAAITLAFLDRNEHPFAGRRISMGTFFRRPGRGGSVSTKDKGKLHAVVKAVLYISSLAFWLVIVLFFTKLFGRFL